MCKLLGSFNKSISHSLGLYTKRSFKEHLLKIILFIYLFWGFFETRSHFADLAGHRLALASEIHLSLPFEAGIKGVNH